MQCGFVSARDWSLRRETARISMVPLFLACPRPRSVLIIWRKSELYTSEMFGTLATGNASRSATKRCATAKDGLIHEQVRRTQGSRRVRTSQARRVRPSTGGAVSRLDPPNSSSNASSGNANLLGSSGSSRSRCRSQAGARYGPHGRRRAHLRL